MQVATVGSARICICPVRSTVDGWVGSITLMHAINSRVRAGLTKCVVLCVVLCLPGVVLSNCSRSNQNSVVDGT